jgi:hypothetical protein
LNITSIYPNYREGDLIVPNKLVQAMLLLQTDEQTLTRECLELVEGVDNLKFQVDKLEKQIEYLLDKAMVEALVDINVEAVYRKNKESLQAYLKTKSAIAPTYQELMKKLIGAKGKLADAKFTHAKYDLAIKAVQNSVNTAVNVLSYLKHEEKMSVA